MKKMRVAPAVEILFAVTADGLCVERCILKPSCASDERDLRKFAQRVLDGLVVTMPSETSTKASQP